MARSLTLSFARTLPGAATPSASSAAATTTLAAFAGALSFGAGFTATLSAFSAAAFAARVTSALASAAATVAALGRTFWLRHQRLARQAQTSALVALDELHLHAIALLDHVFGLLGAAPLHLGDVQQSFGAG